MDSLDPSDARRKRISLWNMSSLDLGGNDGRQDTQRLQRRVIRGLAVAPLATWESPDLRLLKCLVERVLWRITSMQAKLSTWTSHTLSDPGLFNGGWPVFRNRSTSYRAEDTFRLIRL